MKRILWLIVFVALTPFVMAENSQSQEIEIPPLELSGFADILWQVHDPEFGTETFALGQAEIDLATSLEDRIDVEMAVAYDPDAGSFGLGALVMDFRLFGDPESHFFSFDGVDHAGLVIGQMDVPFGIDWMVYPSIDRKLITGPLVVGGTHDGWNDLGAAAYLESGHGNAIIYALNGTGYGPPDQPDETVGGDIGNAYGGRLGLTLLPGWELGASYASIVTRGNVGTSRLWGADVQWARGPYSCKGEFIRQELGLDADLELTHEGWYTQAMYHPEKFFLVARYGLFDPEDQMAPKLTRFSLGCGHVVVDGAEIRCEYVAGRADLDDRVLAQLVVGF